jgi:DNA polymerase III alpha subunit
MVAAINNGGGFIDLKFTFMKPKWVVASFTIRVSIKFLNYGLCVDIYLGFMLLNNLNSDFIHNIVTERELNGDYTSVENFINRIQTGLKHSNTYIYWCIQSTGKSKVN